MSQARTRGHTGLTWRTSSGSAVRAIWWCCCC